MQSLSRALPRRRPNRVRLVEPDGSAARPSAESWPAWTDNHFWECGESPHDLAARVAPLPEPEPEPDAPDGEAGWVQLMVEASLPPARIPGVDPEPESDAAFFARLASEEAAERDRIASTYRPTAADLAEYGEWLASLGDGPAPYAVEPGHAYEDWEALQEPRHTIAEWDAIHSGQVTATELAMRAAGMAL